MLTENNGDLPQIHTPFISIILAHKRPKMVLQRMCDVSYEVAPLPISPLSSSREFAAGNIIPSALFSAPVFLLFFSIFTLWLVDTFAAFASLAFYFVEKSIGESCVCVCVVGGKDT